MKKKIKISKTWMVIGIIGLLLIGGFIGMMLSNNRYGGNIFVDGQFDSFVVDNINPLAFGNLEDICYQNYDRNLFFKSDHIICYGSFSANIFNNIACSCYGTEVYLRK